MLKRPLVDPTALLSNFRFPGNAREYEYILDDPKYAPFFYYLGKEIKPKKAFFYGLNIGLVPYSFFSSCNTVKDVFLYNPTDENYSPRFFNRNLKHFYKNNITIIDSIENLNLSFDVIFHEATEDQEQNRYVLETLWKKVYSGGCLVVEAVEKKKESKEVVITLSKNINRELIYFNTRYGTAILVK